MLQAGQTCRFATYVVVSVFTSLTEASLHNSSSQKKTTFPYQNA